MYVCMCVCMYKCMYVCTHVVVHTSLAGASSGVPHRHLAKRMQKLSSVNV